MAEPIRTCVGCGARDRRAELTRLVARAGALEIDAARRATGRGAYLHARAACTKAFARRGGFVRSLRCVIAKVERELLLARLPEVRV
jgi:predicted RNA-binding protein YlxR (DUF448 family)